jgi:hypothetical protein
MVAGLLVSVSASASAQLSAGVWWVYGYTHDSDFSSPAFSDTLDAETGGNFSDPAMVLYADDDGSHGPWRFSAEARLGQGSFTDPRNNTSGDFVGLHKAWIGHDFSDNLSLKVGKHQVPFGWKTANFWPGDLLQGGYGDQMDLGFKLSGQASAFQYDLAYYHQDDWGENSTDTMDDNAHWGASDTWRKIKTGVVNADWKPDQANTLGVSWQSGRMQDLYPLQDQNSASPGVQRNIENSNDEGRHDALDLHYLYEGEQFTGKYRFIRARRDFEGMDAFLNAPTGPGGISHGQPADNEVKTDRHVAHLGWQQGAWHYVLEASTATTDTEGNTADRIQAFAPGVRYNYGPGWIYLEYLSQNGDIGRNGDIYEADFRSVYVAFDFYF